MQLNDATIVFDLDGTLVDTAPDLAAATNHALACAGLEPMTVAELRPFIGYGSRVMLDAGLRHHGRSLRGTGAQRVARMLLSLSMPITSP